MTDNYALLPDGRIVLMQHGVRSEFRPPMQDPLWLNTEELSHSRLTADQLGVHLANSGDPTPSVTLHRIKGRWPHHNHRPCVVVGGATAEFADGSYLLHTHTLRIPGWK